MGNIQHERFIRALKLAKSDLELSSRHYRACSDIELTRAALLTIEAEAIDAITDTKQGEKLHKLCIKGIFNR